MTTECKAAMCILIMICTIGPMIFMTIRSKRWMAKQTAGGDTYVVRGSLLYRGAGIVGNAFFLTMIFLTIIFLDAEPAALITFLFFTVLCMLEYFVSLFRAIVVCENKGTMGYYHPPFQPVMVRISEITKVQFLESRQRSLERYKVRVFRHEKKLFEVEDTLDGFERITAYLLMTEKSRESEVDGYDYGVYGNFTIEPGYMKQGDAETAELKDDFSVTETTSEKAILGGAMSFWLLMIILLVFDWREWIWDKEFYIYFAVVLLLVVGLAAEFGAKMLNKVSVGNHKIRVRDRFGRIGEYSVREITAIEEKEHYIALYTGEKRIAKIFKDYVNFASFEEWLIRELENDE